MIGWKCNTVINDLCSRKSVVDKRHLSLFYCNLCIYCICNCLSLYVQFISGATPKWFSSRTCKICLKWLWKKSHNLHNLLHNSSFISCNLPHKFRVIWVFFFYHTLSESLCLLQVNTSLVVLIFYMYSSSINVTFDVFNVSYLSSQQLLVKPQHLVSLRTWLTSSSIQMG